MIKPTRRHTLAGLAALSALPLMGTRQSTARVVVIGGGFGGATAARYLRHLDSAIRVTLIEPKQYYWACPLSNLVIGGVRDMSQQRFDYRAMREAGVRVIQDFASDIDPIKKTVAVQNGQSLDYDYLIMSPGIDMRWGAVEGYDEAASALMPHGWKAGAQTELLAKRLAGMKDGGTVIISVPDSPYRCPPGPYERASVIAHYLKTQKPKSKLIILDAKDSFSKQGLFNEAWDKNYSDIIDWRGRSDDGRVIGVSAKLGEIRTDFETHSPDVANIIPPQKAAEIAARAGLTDASGWCPINAVTFESGLQKNIYVIGDAAIANPMPKSAFSAGLQGKVVAIQIARAAAGLPPQTSVLTNTCYSYVTPNGAVSITGVYDNKSGVLSAVPGAGGTSPLGASDDERGYEAAQALTWFNNAVTEAFG